MEFVKLLSQQQFLALQKVEMYVYIFFSAHTHNTHREITQLKTIDDTLSQFLATEVYTLRTNSKVTTHTQHTIHTERE
jgi:hypothetical protein